ncbi:MAG: hypothetical protein HFH62_01765 [Lachnospiraceae bacterium]|nr:hypothetical protein [Lachnospiraceae bacterium]
MRRKFCIIALSIAMLLVGCGTDVPDLSRVDNNVAAQYVADALLRGDKHYDESLDYDHSILEPTHTPEPTPVPTATPGNDGEPGGGQGTQDTPQVSNVSLSELYGIPGVAIEQSTYEVKNSYGAGKYAAITPKAGKKLAVVYFKVSNDTGKAKKVALDGKNVDIQLYLNGKSEGRPLLSIADGDMQSFNEKIGAGKKKQGVLLFEIDKSVKIDKLEVQFGTEGRQASVAVR